MEISLNEQAKLEKYEEMQAENTALRADNERLEQERNAAICDMINIVNGDGYCYKCKQYGICEKEKLWWNCDGFEWQGLKEM